MYINRHLEKQVLEASHYYPVVMVCGQRQVGKSTMLNHIKEPERRYVTMDDGNARRLAQQDPALFFETYGVPLLIDEFQRVPSILLEMKRIVDQKAWVSILERSGIIYILRPYFSDMTRRLVKTPKFYFMDTGLVAYLCRWPSAATIENGAMDGAFLETYVVTEIIKSYYNVGKQSDLYYYRDVDDKEIDLLVVEGDKIYPIEIKKGKVPKHPDKNFSVLNKFKLEIQPGIILCMSDELIPFNRESWYCPISVL